MEFTCKIWFVDLQLIREYKIEYHYKPLKYKVTFMYAPDGELKFNMINRNKQQRKAASLN